jgi:hypothetical protein
MQNLIKALHCTHVNVRPDAIGNISLGKANHNIM